LKPAFYSSGNWGQRGNSHFITIEVVSQAKNIILSSVKANSVQNRVVPLFDLDGTLTDPRRGLVNCVQYAFEAMRKSCPPEEELLQYIGPPLRRMFATLLNTSDTGKIEQAVSLYRERYSQKGVYETQAYPGVPEMLRECRGLAARTYLATSKPRVFAERIIAHLGFANDFAGIYGVELDGRLDDKALLLEHLLDREALTAGSCVMIGDRAADIVAAKANHMPSIGVLWGYGSEEELLAAGAGTICRRPEEIAGLLQLPSLP